MNFLRVFKRPAAAVPHRTYGTKKPLKQFERFMELVIRFELTTSSLPMTCSTYWATPALLPCGTCCIITHSADNCNPFFKKLLYILIFLSIWYSGSLFIVFAPNIFRLRFNCQSMRQQNYIIPNVEVRHKFGYNDRCWIMCFFPIRCSSIKRNRQKNTLRIKFSRRLLLGQQ